MSVTPLPLEPDRLERLRERLKDRDWREVTLEELAEAAGVSRMTLHRRGIAKEGVLAQLAALLEREYRDAVFPALVADGPAPERLEAALEALCEVGERYLGLLDALGRANLFLLHDHGSGPVMTRASVTGAIRRILEDGAGQGSLRADDPDEAATLLFNAVSHTYRHMRLGHRWDPERVRGRLVPLLIEGVKRE